MPIYYNNSTLLYLGDNMTERHKDYLKEAELKEMKEQENKIILNIERRKKMNNLLKSLPDVFYTISVIGGCILVLLFVLIITSIDSD